MDDLTTDLPPDPAADAAEATLVAEDAQAAQRMTFGALIISFFLLLGKVAGYAKNMLISGWFTGPRAAQADAYYNVYNVIVYGMYTNMEKVLRPAYMPQFVRERKSEGEPEAWRLLSVIANLEFLLLVVLTGLVEVFAPQIVRSLWKQLAADPGSFALTVKLMRVMAPALIPLGMSLMPELTLHAHKRFALAALGEFAFRVMLVAAMAVGLMTLWRPGTPDALMATALAAILGSLTRLCTMLPGLRKELSYYRLLLDPRRLQGAMVVLGLIPPVLVGIIATFLRQAADSVYSDRLGTGMYTYLNFGRQMGDSALQIIPLAVSFVVYPFLSEWAVRGEKDKLTEALVGMTRVMTFMFVPLSVGMMALSRPIITIMFEHGQMTSEGAALSAVALFCYAPGIIFTALESSINKWYFALQDTKTPNYWGAVMAGLHVAIGFVGVMVLWPRGIVGEAGALAFVALALTISKSAKVILLYALLRPRLGFIDRRRVLAFAAKLALATAIMALVIHFIGAALQAPLDQWQPPFMAKKLRMLALFGAVGCGGLITFLGVAALAKIEELAMIWGYLSQKVRARLAR
jgi:putative peptidoglycan lipid II flippase